MTKNLFLKHSDIFTFISIPLQINTLNYAQVTTGSMMKKQLFLLSLILFSFGKTSHCQRVITTDEAVYTIDGASDFVIIKRDARTDKVIYKAKTEIPGKQQKFNPYINSAKFNLVNEQIVIVYSVWNQREKSKDCYLKVFNTGPNTFSDPKRLYSAKLNSFFSSGEISYPSAYSADKSKLAVLKFNDSKGYSMNHELTIIDTETFEAISSTEIDLKYEGKRTFLDQSQMSVDNSGNVAIGFYFTNPETGIRIKSFSANIPFNGDGLTDVKELDEASSELGGSESTHGRFFRSLQDYMDDESIPGVRIKNGSFQWTLVTGIAYKLIDDAGNVKSEDVQSLPSDLFTYKSFSGSSDAYLVRLIDNKPYIVLVVGNLCFYALYQNQEARYYSEGWNGALKKFNERAFEARLEEHNLLKDYENDRPKREWQDDVNGYFNKIIHWQIKYVKLLNEKSE